MVAVIGDPPSLPHRALRSSVEVAEAFPGDVVGERFQPAYGDRVPVRRFEKLTATRHAGGAVEAMPHWAGESGGDVEHVWPAAAILRELPGRPSSFSGAGAARTARRRVRDGSGVTSGAARDSAGAATGLPHWNATTTHGSPCHLDGTPS